MKTVLLNCIIGAIIYFIGIFIGCMISRVEPKTQKPIEIVKVDSAKIDSIVIVKDSIIYKVKVVKEIQYEEIEKANNLSDSASVALFYKLLAD